MDAVEVKVLVDAAQAKLLEAGLNANIVMRRKDGTLRKFIKCKVLGANSVSSNKANELVGELINKTIKNAHVDMGNLRSSMKDIRQGIGKLTDITKDMAINVDQIFKATNITKTLSYINVGMTLANMAVDIAGFVIVCNKINELSSRIQELSDKLDKLGNIEKNKLIKGCRDNALNCNSMLEKMSLKEEIDLDELEKFINDFTNYINMVIDILVDEAIDSEVLLTIMNYLIPSYSLIVCEFIDRYYFKKGLLPANTNSYLAMFDRLTSSNYINKLEDYFFFEEKLSTIDTMDAVSAQVLLGVNGRVQIEDQIEILKELKTREKVEEFKQNLEEYAKLKFEEDVEELYESSDKWKSELESLRAS